jgi:hypothetical protein
MSMSLDREKFAKVLGILGSLHEGEQLAAVRRANSMECFEPDDRRVQRRTLARHTVKRANLFTKGSRR